MAVAGVREPLQQASREAVEPAVEPAVEHAAADVAAAVVADAAAVGAGRLPYPRPPSTAGQGYYNETDGGEKVREVANRETSLKVKKKKKTIHE